MLTKRIIPCLDLDIEDGRDKMFRDNKYDETFSAKEAVQQLLSVTNIMLLDVITLFNI